MPPRGRRYTEHKPPDAVETVVTQPAQDGEQGEVEVPPQRGLCERIGRYIKEWFTFVAIPGVPSENNAAERSLRHLVVSR